MIIKVKQESKISMHYFTLKPSRLSTTPYVSGKMGIQKRQYISHLHPSRKVGCKRHYA